MNAARAAARLAVSADSAGENSRHSATASSMAARPSWARRRAPRPRRRRQVTQADQKKPIVHMPRAFANERSRSSLWTARREIRLGARAEVSTMTLSLTAVVAPPLGVQGSLRPSVDGAGSVAEPGVGDLRGVRPPAVTRQPASPVADLGRPNVSTRRVASRPTARGAAAIARTAMSQSTRSLVLDEQRDQHDREHGADNPPRRPYALVPASSARPAPAVHSNPVVGTTGPEPTAAMSTTATAAIGIDSAIRPAVSAAATVPGDGPGRRPAGSGPPRAGPP